MSNTYNSKATFEALDTPFFYVNKPKYLTNLERLRTRIEGFGVSFRPHFKTARTLESAPYLCPTKQSPITVSTVKEAEALVAAGYTDILYAVGISLKLPRIHALNAENVQVSVLLDSMEQAECLNQYCHENKCSISTLIEIDVDGHRAGLKPDDALVIEIAKTLTEGDAKFQGVLAHAGGSYNCYDKASLETAAQNEVDQINAAVACLKTAGISCETVSIGSTPTAHNYQDLTGVTEVRAGVYGFYDLVMAGIGVCTTEDIAASVVATITGHNREKGWLIIDAGWMALSSDRGTAKQPRDCGYGLVTNMDGALLENLCVTSVNQEHGIITSTGPDTLNVKEFPIGEKLHILPNHACATASMHDVYYVFDDQSDTSEIWTRVRGW